MVTPITLLYSALTLVQALQEKPYQITVEAVPVELPGWPAGAAPARVVLLSDIHARTTDAPRVQELVQTASRLQPEAVILLGDYGRRNAPATDMPPATLAQRLAPLQKHCPVYYVSGNHDDAAAGSALRQAFDAQGFVFVEQQNATLTFSNGCQATLSGVPYRAEQLSTAPLKKRLTLQGGAPALPLIVASHSPWHFQTSALPGDLIVSGHTHGGQICLPGGQPIFQRGMWKHHQLRGGLHHGKRKGQQIYVSRGTGTSSIPIRLHCCPEVSLLLLTGSHQGNTAE